jgi:hypothetical protein
VDGWSVVHVIVAEVPVMAVATTEEIAGGEIAAGEIAADEIAGSATAVMKMKLAEVVCRPAKLVDRAA